MACASHREIPGYEKLPRVLACRPVPASNPYCKVLTGALKLQSTRRRTLSLLEDSYFPQRSPGEDWLEEIQSETKKEGGREDGNNSNLSSPRYFFLGRGYSECQLCCAAVQRTFTSEKSTSLHSIHPIELPALVINSESCAVTVGLWTQQLPAGRQALFHRGHPPISCTQLSSSSSPAVQSTTAAEGGSFHCCHRPRRPDSFHHTFFFTSSFLNSQLYTNIRPRLCAGLICLF